jgi:hypothetical protein
MLERLVRWPGPILSLSNWSTLMQDLKKLKGNKGEVKSKTISRLKFVLIINHVASPGLNIPGLNIRKGCGPVRGP